MSFLLDVNVLVAMSWPSHLHHMATRRWFEAHATEGWMTTPATESGFVRVSANPAVFAVRVAPLEALRQLERLRALGRHRFLADDVEMVVGPEWAGSRLLGHRVVTDAHLLALARQAKGVLVTLDAGLLHLAGSHREDVLLIEGRR